MSQLTIEQWNDLVAACKGDVEEVKKWRRYLPYWYCADGSFSALGYRVRREYGYSESRNVPFLTADENIKFWRTIDTHERAGRIGVSFQEITDYDKEGVPNNEPFFCWKLKRIANADALKEFLNNHLDYSRDDLFGEILMDIGVTVLNVQEMQWIRTTIRAAVDSNLCNEDAFLRAQQGLFPFTAEQLATCSRPLIFQPDSPEYVCRLTFDVAVEQVRCMKLSPLNGMQIKTPGLWIRNIPGDDTTAAYEGLNQRYLGYSFYDISVGVLGRTDSPGRLYFAPSTTGDDWGVDLGDDMSPVKASSPREALRLAGVEWDLEAVQFMKYLFEDLQEEKERKQPCGRCGDSLERGRVERYQGNIRIEAFCFRCDEKERRTDFEQTGILSTKLLMLAGIYSVNREFEKVEEDELLEKVLKSEKTIRVAFKQFELNVWFGGLQQQVISSEYRGLRNDFSMNDVQCHALVWSCAGRVLFTLEPIDHSFQVTLIAAETESEPRMGIQGIQATEEQALNILAAATQACANGTEFCRDDQISYL